MRKLVRVEREYVLFTLSYAARRALRRVLGRGNHEPLAERIAAETVASFDLAGWQVHRLDTPSHSTSGPREGQDGA